MEARHSRTLLTRPGINMLGFGLSRAHALTLSAHADRVDSYTQTQRQGKANIQLHVPHTVSTQVTREGAETELRARGRHDACVVPRAVPMVEAMVAMVLADQMLQHYAQVGA